MSSLIDKALKIAYKAHKGQKCKGGADYITHPLAVRELAIKNYEKIMYLNESFKNDVLYFGKDYKEEVEIVSILHDAVEDSDLTLDDLRKEGFSEIIIQAVDSVTEREGETYFEKVLRAKANSIGRLVKYADITHNSSTLKRKKNKHKYDKYLLAKYILENNY